MGHAPLLANSDFAALSQTIGLASLGASDDEVTSRLLRGARVFFAPFPSLSGSYLSRAQIRRLAACYWFSVEFRLAAAAAAAAAAGAA